MSPIALRCIKVMKQLRLKITSSECELAPFVRVSYGHAEADLRSHSVTTVSLLAILLAATFALPSGLAAQSAARTHCSVYSPETQPRTAASSRSAQSSPKPKASLAPARTTLAGPWKLNRNESDDPQQIVRTAERSRNSNPSNTAGAIQAEALPAVAILEAVIRGAATQAELAVHFRRRAGQLAAVAAVAMTSKTIRKCSH